MEAPKLTEHDYYRLTPADFYKITWRMALGLEPKTMFVSSISDDTDIVTVGDIANEEILDGGVIIAIEYIGTGFAIADYVPPTNSTNE